LFSNFPFDCEKWIAFDKFSDLDFVWQLFELLVVPGDVPTIHITLQFEENQIGFDGLRFLVWTELVEVVWLLMGVC
jgi:hypothetical protein